MPPDFTSKYNTRLEGPEEIQFRMWARNQRRGPAADAMNDLYDYDLRGWWKKNGSKDLTDAHLTDEFKKPNHPTFSDESIYHGVDDHQGGKWIGTEKTGYMFQPAKTNLEMRSLDELNEYFVKYEPDAMLISPTGPQAAPPQ